MPSDSDKQRAFLCAFEHLWDAWEDEFPKTAKWVATLLKALCTASRTNVKSLRSDSTNDEFEKTPPCLPPLTNAEARWNDFVRAIHEKGQQKKVPTFATIRTRAPSINKLLRLGSEKAVLPGRYQISFTADRISLVFRPDKKKVTSEPSGRDHEITEDVAGELVARFVGVDAYSLSETVKGNLNLVALVCAKRLAYELRESVSRCREEINRLRERMLEPIESIDSALRAILLGLKDTSASIVTLSHDLDAFAIWAEYGQIARPVYGRLSRFYERMCVIASGYNPSGFKQSLGKKLDLRAQYKLFRSEIEQILPDFDNWRRDSVAFYETQCRRLWR